jgi:hypothetical protein
VSSSAYTLSQNYPNPFAAGITSISYSVPTVSLVRVSVFDMLGRKVATLVDGIMSEGTHTAQWNARHIHPGVYLYKLEAGGTTLTRSMTILK